MFIVMDPDSGKEVDIEIYKDLNSGGMFGIEASFIKQVNDTILSPLQPVPQWLYLSEEK